MFGWLSVTQAQAVSYFWLSLSFYRSLGIFIRVFLSAFTILLFVLLYKWRVAAEAVDTRKTF